MDDLTRQLQTEYILFVDDVLLVNGDWERINDKSKFWIHILRLTVLGQAKRKIWSKQSVDAIVVKLNGEVIPNNGYFCYLRSILQRNDGIEWDLNHKLKQDE